MTRYGWYGTVVTVCAMAPPLVPAMSRLRLPEKSVHAVVMTSMLPDVRDQSVRSVEGEKSVTKLLGITGPISKLPLATRLVQPTTNMHRRDPPALSTRSADLLLVVTDVGAETVISLAPSYSLKEEARSTYTVVVMPVGATTTKTQEDVDPMVPTSTGTQDWVMKLTPGQWMVL
jgi:hypothetical protein